MLKYDFPSPNLTEKKSIEVFQHQYGNSYCMQFKVSLIMHITYLTQVLIKRQLIIHCYFSIVSIDSLNYMFSEMFFGLYYKYRPSSIVIIITTCFVLLFLIPSDYSSVFIWIPCTCVMHQHVHL